MFFSGLVLRIKIKKRWTSLTDYVDFCSVLHGLQIAEYSYYLALTIDNDIVSFQIGSLIWALFDAYIIKKSSELILNSIYLFNKTFIIFTISWP